KIVGIDLFFIELQNLAASMNHLGKPEHPEVQAVIQCIEEAAKQARKPLGIESNGKKEEFENLIQRGYSMIAISPDYELIKQAPKNFAQLIFKDSIKETIEPVFNPYPASKL